MQPNNRNYKTFINFKNTVLQIPLLHIFNARIKEISGDLFKFTLKII